MGLAKTFLAVGISIIFVVFIAYGLYVVYEPPKYNYEKNTCYEQYKCGSFFEKCNKINRSDFGIFDDNCYRNVETNPEYIKCRENFDKCNEEYKKTTERYKNARNSFYILIVIGVMSIIAGMNLNKYEGIGSGFIGGGVLVVLWSLIYTWEYVLTINRYIKLIILGLILVLLVYLGYKRIEKRR